MPKLNLARIALERSIKRYLGRAQERIGLPVSFFETPIEEQNEIFAKGEGSIHSFGADGKGKKTPIRDEECYLYATRRFPQATNNVLPAGSHMPAQDNLFFNTQVGGDATAAGFPTGFQYSSLETNITTSSQIPKGLAYKLKQLGISVNAEAANGDIQQLMDAGDLVFSRNGIEYSLRLGPALFWPGGVGVVTATQVQGAQSSHNGVADWKAMRYLKIARTIKALDQFNFNYHVPRPVRASDGTPWILSQFTEMRVVLWGLQVNVVAQ
jgi:hypothetical protein